MYSQKEGSLRREPVPSPNHMSFRLGQTKTHNRTYACKNNAKINCSPCFVLTRRSAHYCLAAHTRRSHTTTAIPPATPPASQVQAAPPSSFRARPPSLFPAKSFPGEHSRVLSSDTYSGARERERERERERRRVTERVTCSFSNPNERVSTCSFVALVVVLVVDLIVVIVLVVV